MVCVCVRERERESVKFQAASQTLNGCTPRCLQAHDVSVMPQLLDTLQAMIRRSSKLAVALALGGLVPWLLALLDAAAPILRVKILEIIRWGVGLISGFICEL